MYCIYIHARARNHIINNTNILLILLLRGFKLLLPIRYVTIKFHLNETSLPDVKLNGSPKLQQYIYNSKFLRKYMRVKVLMGYSPRDILNGTFVLQEKQLAHDR